jgi:hypothetical protein
MRKGVSCIRSSNLNRSSTRVCLQLLKLGSSSMLASPKGSAAENWEPWWGSSNPACRQGYKVWKSGRPCLTCRLSAAPAAGGVHNLFRELHPGCTRTRGMSSIHTSHPTLTFSPTVGR